MRLRQKNSFLIKKNVYALYGEKCGKLCFVDIFGLFIKLFLGHRLWNFSQARDLTLCLLDFSLHIVYGGAGHFFCYNLTITNDWTKPLSKKLYNNFEKNEDLPRLFQTPKKSTKVIFRTTCFTFGAIESLLGFKNVL